MAIKPKSYETLYLIRPDISSEDLTVIQNKLTKSISAGDGEIQRDEKWADRDLAYPINDYTKGSYYILAYKALPSVPAEIEKHLSFHKTDVLRFITVLNEEEPLNEDAAQSIPEETAPGADFTSSNNPVATGSSEPGDKVTEKGLTGGEE